MLPCGAIGTPIQCVIEAFKETLYINKVDAVDASIVLRCHKCAKADAPPLHLTETKGLINLKKRKKRINEGERIKMKNICLKSVQKNYEKYRNSETRFSLKVYVTSKIWETNEKKSVWVEDPKQEGKTIMCTFRSEYESFDGIKLHGFYWVQNVLINHNATKDLPTYAEYQIVLDELSEIRPLKKEPLVYKPIKSLAEIPNSIDVESIGEYCDLIAVPLMNYDSHDEDSDISPRRIKMVDGSGQHLVWTLWNEDKENTRAIRELMKTPILFRNAIVKYFCGCQFQEWQLRFSLCNIVTEHPLIDDFEKRLAADID